MSWMRWTLGSAAFFGSIIAMLVFLTFYDMRSPGYPRKGILPIKTSRGDRVFMSLLTWALIMLLWLALVPSLPPWWPMGISAIAGTIILRWF